ncbi:hypothetical protein BXT92_20905 [Klebsiella pneumoniae]|nr:hypothetical protein BXT92_20905 [Klebsiella pneumoniae]
MNDNKMTPGELRATWGLGTVFSLRMLGMFMVLPVLTTYGMALQGASEALIGLAIGIYGLAQAVFQIPFGLLSDRIGRKPLIVGGLLIFVLGSVIAALTDSIWGIILGRALQGSGAIAAAVMALLSDLTREQNRTKAMAFIGVSFGVTFAIAMVLGPIVTHQLGLHALFWMIAILATVGILLTLWVVPNSHNHVLNRESGMVKGCFSKVLAEPRLLKLNFGIMCLHIMLMSTFVALPGQLEAAGFPAAEHWKIYLVTMVISFISVVPFIIYAEVKRKMKRVFLLCVAILLIAEIVLWGAGGYFWELVAGVQLFFLAFNLLEALLPSLISKETVFLLGALLAMLWLLVASTMSEPPYVSSLRVEVPDGVVVDSALQARLLSASGVHQALVVPEERSVYIKIDSKVTNRFEIEQLIKGV